MISHPIYIHPIDWARQQIGQKEIKGGEHNPQIVWYHSHSGNLKNIQLTDEIPWCSSFLNALADECGMIKTDSALACSWDKYGIDCGDLVLEGDIVTLKFNSGSRHVCIANRDFNKRIDKTFEGLGGNQADQVKVSLFSCSAIIATRKWIPKKNTIHEPKKSKPDRFKKDQTIDERTR